MKKYLTKARDHRLLIWIIAILMRIISPTWNEPLSVVFWSLCGVAASLGIWADKGLRKISSSLILIGLGLNALVVLANNGRMPVRGWSLEKWGKMGVMWQVATEHTKFLYLADIHLLKHIGLFSVGDVVIVSSILFLVLFNIFEKKIARA